MPHTYRSKPVTIEAALVKEDTIAKVAEWCGGKVRQVGLPVITGTDKSYNVVVVPTINGEAVAEVGHYVIKGPNDFYPCDPDTFASRWERVD